MTTPQCPTYAHLAAQVGELQEALDAIKWGVDYLLNCHTEPMKFVAMYGSSEVMRLPCTTALFSLI